MKKILLIATLAAISGLSAFAQGNFSFGSPASYVWNGPAGTRGGNYNVGFLWSSSVSTPNVATTSGIAGTRTNATENFSGNPWTAILNDPNFALAQNADSANATVVGTLSSTGAIVYNLGSSFHVTGSSSGGGTATVFMIAWDNAFATPQLAAANSAAVGWSRSFSYSYANNSTAASATLGQTAAGLDSNIYKFGVSPVVAVPEPATFALAGLGMAAMLIARRRK